jgi:hypothetical protein
MKKIDKKILRESLAQYEVRNSQEFHQKIKSAGKKSDLQKWQEFLSIMDFGLKIKPIPSKKENQQKLEMLNNYINKMKLFETRKSQSGKSN